jgi:WhiB family transcriptional regulator, redox-sensing transcriptional regulator
MITARNWRLDAACRTSDPDLFFPVGATGPAIPQIAEARRVCQGCPVRAACLDWALRHDQAYGIWGGTTEEERRARRRAPGPRPAEPQRPRYLHRRWQADAS